jgi:DNA-binding NtrC family response regulator
MDKKTILVVDDDRDVLECIHGILTLHGYESVPCSDTSAALTLLASEASLDLAIIDLVMPEMNGLELHARVKQLRPELPCIIVTGCSSIESYLNAINNGAFGYLNKPYRFRELITVVAAALEK